MVVKLEIVVQRLLQVSPAIEAGLLQELADAAVKALDHAVCLWMTRWCQAVFYTHAYADLVEHMLAAGLLVLAGETVRELRAIIGQDFADFDRRSFLEKAEKIDAARISHVVIDVQKNPARGAVNGHEQITARCLVGHLREILDIDVNKARLVVFEGLLSLDRFAFGSGNDVFQTSHTFALEQAGQSGP